MADQKLIEEVGKYIVIDDLGTMGQISFESVGSEKTQECLRKLVRVAKNLGQKYEAVVTNLPYLSNSRFSPTLDKYIKDNYSDVKTDLSMVMFKHALKDLCNTQGFVSFITTSSWMFLSSFEKLRSYVFDRFDFVSVVDFGTELFEGKVGHNPIAAWINRKSSTDYTITSIRLVEFCYSRRNEKEKEYFNKENYYYPKQSNFSKIPGEPVAYWVDEKYIHLFNNNIIHNIGQPRFGMSTSDNARFVRSWSEISYISFAHPATEEFNVEISKKWFPYNNGGEFRRWYGNNYDVVNWENDGSEIRTFGRAAIRNSAFYLKKGITWTAISSAKIAVREFEYGFLFSSAGFCIFSDRYGSYLLAVLNSKVGMYFLKIFSPTMNFNVGDIARIPVLFDINEQKVNRIAEKCVALSRMDWDSFEISWDFQHHPLIQKLFTIAESFEQWQNECNDRFNQLKANEEELNCIFIDIYGLQNELTPEVEDKDVTVRKADLSRDIRSVISYAVGCMFGRYSLDEEGLIYAGGEWDSSRYQTFIPDNDNCIPITDEEYFSDDIVSRFVEFVKVVYGADTLEENLDFIANALGNKGDTSREVICNYFLKDFFADHLKVYQKRPIYWLFDSGKQNGFKALIYMHRYDADTVGRVRTDYLHRAQKYVETAMQSAQYTIDNASSASEKSKATKAVTKYTKQLAEMKIYDETIAHIANKRIEIDLDDGVKVNYEKFQGVEVAQEGKKALKVDLLAKLK